jgi:hypothetical protein
MAEDIDKDVVGTSPSELLKGLETSEWVSVQYADVVCGRDWTVLWVGLDWK